MNDQRPLNPENPRAAVDRIDALCGATQSAAAGDLGPWTDLMTATLHLPVWYFVARGEVDSPRPLSVVFEHGPTVLAFTTAARARSGAVSVGIPASEAGLLLKMATPDVVDTVGSLAAQGVTGISFDHPVLGYYLPIPTLLDFRDWLAAQPND